MKAADPGKADAGDAKEGAEGKLPTEPTSAMVVRTVIRENHGDVIRKVAFNRTLPPREGQEESICGFGDSAGNVFATVGGNQASVYDGRNFGNYVGLVVHYTHDEEGVELATCCWADARGFTKHPKGDLHLCVGASSGDVLVLSVAEAAVTHLLRGHKGPVAQLATSPSKPGKKTMTRRPRRRGRGRGRDLDFARASGRIPATTD